MNTSLFSFLGPVLDLFPSVRPIYTSDIENRRHQSLLEHRRIGVGKSPMSMLQKLEFARGWVCSGRKTTAVNSDVKTRFFSETGRRQQLTRQLITAHVQVIASTLPHTHPPHTSQKCVYGYNPDMSRHARPTLSGLI